MRLVALRVLAGSWAKLELSFSALEMLGYFELQVIDIPHGQEDIINGDGPFFEVQHSAYIMKGLFANDLVVQGQWSSFGILNDIWVQVHLFAC